MVMENGKLTSMTPVDHTATDAVSAYQTIQFFIIIIILVDFIPFWDPFADQYQVMVRVR